METQTTNDSRTYESRAVVLARTDIDTDQILPARFMVRLTFAGLEHHAFEDERAAFRAQNRVHPFDAENAKGAGILLAGANFGCGSSREHAPQALFRRGFRYVIAPSFGEIFAGNSDTIGLICLRADADRLTELQKVCSDDPFTRVTIDLGESLVHAGAVTCPVEVTERTRRVAQGGGDFLERALRASEKTARVLAALPSCCSPNVHGAGI